MSCGWTSSDAGDAFGLTSFAKPLRFAMPWRSMVVVSRPARDHSIPLAADIDEMIIVGVIERHAPREHPNERNDSRAVDDEPRLRTADGRIGSISQLVGQLLERVRGARSHRLTSFLDTSCRQAFGKPQASQAAAIPKTVTHYSNLQKEAVSINKP